MLSLPHPASMQLVAEAHPDPALRSLLSWRIAQLSEASGIELGNPVHSLIFEPGDSLSQMEIELGFTPLQNIVDGCRFPDPEFTPSWEWIEVHEGWFELAYVFSDDDPGTLIFVQRAEGVDPDLIALCNQWSSTTNAA